MLYLGSTTGSYPWHHTSHCTNNLPALHRRFSLSVAATLKRSNTPWGRVDKVQATRPSPQPLTYPNHPGHPLQWCQTMACMRCSARVVQFLQKWRCSKCKTRGRCSTTKKPVHCYISVEKDAFKVIEINSAIHFIQILLQDVYYYVLLSTMFLN